MDREKVIKWFELFIKEFELFIKEIHPVCTGEGVELDMFREILAMLKEQKKLIDVDELREKLGLSKDCAKCKQNARACQYDSHFSLMDFCERLDMAIDELTK